MRSTLGILGRKTVAGLLVIVADTAQTPVNRCDREAVNEVDHVTEDRLRRGRQGAPLVLLAPRAEVFPVGSIGVKCVFRVTMGDVGTCSRQEIFDGGRCIGDVSHGFLVSSWEANTSYELTRNWI